MCLLTRQIKPIITKKDMIVVKQLTVEEGYIKINGRYDIVSTYHSAFYGKFEYLPNVLNTTTLNVERRLPNEVGAHSDADSKYYKQGPLTNRKLTVVDKGFHFMIEGTPSYNEYIRFSNMNVIFKFLVPKGSMVFLSATGLGVSDRIMMLKP